MYQSLFENIQGIQKAYNINEERKNVLWPLIGYIQKKINDKQRININFICTHNSRRSHLSQIWAQAAASYFNIPGVHCYSGGTEETALFPKIIETLKIQGFNILKISDGNNPVYAIKYSANTPPVIGFSKKYDNPFNPEDSYAAVMTCSQADEGCPFIAGAEVRIPITFEDPKKSDNTPEQTQVYAERSLQIAAEMLYVFSSIKI
ncbi:protein-tyrosine-phosphatase [Elizabethkingia anophelis]|nr:protein-tyrosine-phosphatase [Elizabethkingia anophelis]MDV3565193.1 protein-tyrosine-phosphatase [Elizabethkingia anophelis]MDV3624307.1 protein-tyrosine-phosphatase [Elizabethkingia anophelis]MDV3644190.1 protein-tyrosine-phosphatase [Elizabethkingia anophelis]MDV3658755.1 protein-tyrosine-phosphatase [Elizabethkingia anophelis]